jgi:hypothetical protein
LIRLACGPPLATTGLPPGTLSGRTLGSHLDAADIERVGYFESLVAGEDPSVDLVDRDPTGTQLYHVHHNPIVYFAGDSTARIKPYTSLLPDLDSATSPPFALVVPNMANNMHDPVGSTSDDPWLRKMATRGPRDS